MNDTEILKRALQQGWTVRQVTEAFEAKTASAYKRFAMSLIELAGSLTLTPWLLHLGWDWFAVPVLHAPPLTFLQAVGLVLIASPIRFILRAPARES